MKIFYVNEKNKIITVQYSLRNERFVPIKNITLKLNYNILRVCYV